MSARVVTTLCVILLSSCGTAAAMREPRVAMRIERRPDGFRAKPTPPTPPAPDAPAPTPTGGLGPVEDLVAHLPGYGAPPAPQYSGFLDASAAANCTHPIVFGVTNFDPDDAAGQPNFADAPAGPATWGLFDTMTVRSTTIATTTVTTALRGGRP